MRNQDSFEELLEQSLQNGNQNYFAFALARSRQEEPTARTLQLLKQLISQQGDKWLEVLSRLALLDYRRVFNHCINYPFTYPTLITMASTLQNAQELLNLESRIVEVMDSRYEKLQTRWNIFATLLAKYASAEDYGTETIRLLPLVNRFLQTRPFIDDMQELYTQQTTLNSLPTSQYFATYFAVISGICRLFRKGMTISLKAMRYLDFIRNHTALISWMKEIFPFVVCSFQNLRQFAHFGQTIEGTMYSNALSCLVDFSNIHEIAEQLQEHSTLLIRFLVEQPLLKIWDSQKKQIAEDLNFEYGLVMGEYGDDNPSILTNVINKFANFLPSFLREYISALSSPQFTANLPEGEIYMKLAIVHKSVKQRDDLVLQLVEPFLELLLRDIEPTLPVSTHSQINYCRKLRLLYLYSSILKQSFFNSLLQKITAMLKETTDETYYFAQAIYIFQQILGESTKTSDKTVSKLGRLLKDNVHFIVLKLLDIIQNTPQSNKRGEKRLKLLQLVHKMLDSNQSECTRVNNTVITKCAAWLIEEVGNSWSRGVSTTPFMQEIANTLKVAISIIDEEYYMDVSDSLYAVLELLLHPHALSIQDELLQILVFVLEFEKDIRPPTCSVLVALQNIVISDKGNLFSIRKVIKTLCEPELSRQILFSWSDLILHYLNMQLRYFSDFATPNYINFYQHEWEEQTLIFLNYLQTYEEYLNSNPQTRQNVLFCIHSMPSTEYQLQLFLTLHHQQPVTGYQFYNFSLAQKYHKRSTMKLIYMYYMDALLRNYNESSLNELLQFHSVFREKERSRKLEGDLMSAPHTTNTLTYLREGLLKLRHENHLDMMDYNSLMSQLQLR